MNQTETFIKLKRSDNFRKLLKSHHNELILLLVISSRARRSSDTCSFTGLSQNQAMIGDHAEYGMTERQYRTAKKNLEKWNFSTFNGTSKGTIATLTDSSICDINCEQGADGVTDDRRTGDGRVTTNKNVKKDKKDLIPSQSSGESVGRQGKPDKKDVSALHRTREFVVRFNELLGRDFRAVNQKLVSALSARLKDGYTIDEILDAAKACSLTEYHQKNKQYLTPHFILRADKLESYFSLHKNSKSDVFRVKTEAWGFQFNEQGQTHYEWSNNLPGSKCKGAGYFERKNR